MAKQSPQELELAMMLGTHHELTEIAKQAKAEADTIRDGTLVPLFQSLGRKTMTFVAKGRKFTATMPEQGTRDGYDEDRLKAALGAAVWQKVTTPKLDPDKLQAWLNEAGLPEQERMGRIMKAGSCLVSKPGPKPSPRYKDLGEVEVSELPPAPEAPPQAPQQVYIELPDIPA